MAEVSVPGPEDHDGRDGEPRGGEEGGLLLPALGQRVCLQVSTDGSVSIRIQLFPIQVFLRQDTAEESRVGLQFRREKWVERGGHLYNIYLCIVYTYTDTFMNKHKDSVV